MNLGRHPSRLFIKGLVCSIVAGSVAFAGCDSTTTPNPNAAATNPEFKAQNDALATVKTSPANKGAMPKSIKGGRLGAPAAPSQ
jgi:hypothetical protein